MMTALLQFGPYFTPQSLRDSSSINRGALQGPLAMEEPYYYSPITKRCFVHSIFALSLTRFAFRNPNGITYGYATFDLLLQNSSITKQKSIGSFIVTLMNSPITKRCFVILNVVKNLYPRFSGFFQAKPSTTRLLFSVVKITSFRFMSCWNVVKHLFT